MTDPDELERRANECSLIRWTQGQEAMGGDPAVDLVDVTSHG